MSVHLRGTCERKHQHTAECKTWYYRFSIKNVRYGEAIPEAQTKQEALQVESQARRMVYEGRYGKAMRTMPFEKFVRDVFIPYAKDNRKRWEQDETIANRFVEIFRGRSLQEIPPMLVEQAKRFLVSEEIEPGRRRKASTVNQMLSVAHRIFSLAIENGFLSSNPVDKVRKLKEETARQRVMTEDEEARLREVMEADSWLAPVLTFFAIVNNTGMRREEACYLSRDEVDFDARLIYLPASRTKERKAKTIPMNDTVYKLLSGRGTEMTGKHFVGVSAGHLWTMWRWACERAGVKNLHVHDLRHTFVTRLTEAGYPTPIITQIVGHATIRMTAKYSHPGIEAMRGAVDTLPQLSHKEVKKVRVLGKR